MIRQLPGDIIKADGTQSDIMTLLGVSASALDVPNDGRGHTVSSLVIGGKQYALSTVLERVAEQLSGGLAVAFSGAGTEASPYKADHTFTEMAAASPLTITWNGTPATEVAYTEDDGEITAISAVFVHFGETMDVTTLTINGSGITGETKEYTLTEPETEPAGT